MIEFTVGDTIPWNKSSGKAEANERLLYEKLKKKYEG